MPSKTPPTGPLSENENMLGTTRRTRADPRTSPSRLGLKHGTEATGITSTTVEVSAVGERCSAGEVGPKGPMEVLRELMPI
jgi:hypothetical protein